MKTKYILSYTLIALLVGFSACSDNGGGSEEEGSPPALPNLEFTQPDFSYFNPTAGKAVVGSAVGNYSIAQQLVLGFSSFASIGQIYTGFLTGAESENATFNNGTWEWEYSYSYGGTSSSTRMTARESGNTIDWNVFISLNSGELNFDNYNMMSGSTQNEGKQGEWTYNTFLDSDSQETPLLKSSWVVSSDTEQTNDIIIYNDNGDAVTSINFSRSGSEYLMMVDSNEGSGTDIEVFWDDSADMGYILQDGEQLCWQGRGANATDVACSQIGL